MATLDEAPPSDEERARVRQILQKAMKTWGTVEATEDAK
jgi:hypothetical protein